VGGAGSAAAGGSTSIFEFGFLIFDLAAEDR
jgi:hypothetical protein